MSATTRQPGAIDAALVARQLENELVGHLVSVPQAPHCELDVLVPVYAESPRRVIAQLGSLLGQGVGDRIEVILNVNNPPDDSTAEWRDAFEQNQRILRLPIFRNRTGSVSDSPETRRIRKGLAVHVIDQSSPGLWVPDNNVGRARQRLKAEATLRFARQGRNGLILHTDADCRYDDPSFVERVLWLFDAYSDLVGIIGDYDLELEASDPEAPPVTPQLVRQYKMLHRYRDLHRLIVSGPTRREFIKALGRCIVHRALEGFAAGSIPPVNLGEDVEFGNMLQQYARDNGLRVEHGRRWQLGPVAAMRLSTRTGNDSTGGYTGKANPNGSPIVDDAFNPGTETILDEAYLRRLTDAVRAMPDGESQLERLFVTSPQSRLRVRW